MSEDGQQGQNGLGALLLCRTKSALENECKTRRLNREDLINAINVCSRSSSPLRHRSFFRDILSEKAELKDEDFEAFKGSQRRKFNRRGQKVANKISTILDQSRHLCGHLFWIPESRMWWFLHFSNEDVRKDNNHWVTGGSHIHLVCWLTHPKLNPNDLLNSFANDDKPKIGGHLHIRYDCPPDHHRARTAEAAAAIVPAVGTPW